MYVYNAVKNIYLPNVFHMESHTLKYRLQDFSHELHICQNLWANLILRNTRFSRCLIDNSSYENHRNVDYCTILENPLNFSGIQTTNVRFHTLLSLNSNLAYFLIASLRLFPDCLVFSWSTCCIIVEFNSDKFQF